MLLGSMVSMVLVSDKQTPRQTYIQANISISPIIEIEPTVLELLYLKVEISSKLFHFYRKIEVGPQKI